MNMGNKIKEIRTDYGMSQEQLAMELHVTRQTVSNWENNKNYPDFTTLVKISEMFDVSLDVLVKDDNEYIKNRETVERKFVTRKRWIVVLAVAVIALGGLCIYVYNLGQGTDNAKRVTTNTDVMMTVNLYDASQSRAITKTFNAAEFDNMSEVQKRNVLKEVCGKIEGDIPAVHLGKNTSKIAFDFRTTDYYDIDPHITDIELYTTNSMPAKPQKSSKKKVKYNYSEGVVTVDLMDFIKKEELVFGESASVPEEEQIMDCIFLVRYENGVTEYVSVTAVSILDTTDWSEEKAQNIVKKELYSEENIRADELKIIAQDYLEETHVVAFVDTNNDFCIAAFNEENGENLFHYGETVEGKIPDYYEMSYYDYIKGKYRVITFFNKEIKDVSVEICYEDKSLGVEKYTYNLSEQDREAPAVFLTGPTVKHRNFSVDINVQK